jgi:hypothetical protein
MPIMAECINIVSPLSILIFIYYLYTKIKITKNKIIAIYIHTMPLILAIMGSVIGLGSLINCCKSRK